MPSALTYPGVYIEEVSSGVHTIVGVGTSITAFVGRAERGPTDEPITINGFGEFERTFGGVWALSSLGDAVRAFFLNGGSQAIVVRLYHPKLSEPDRARIQKAADDTAAAAVGPDVNAAATNAQNKANTFTNSDEKSAATAVATAAQGAAGNAGATVPKVTAAAQAAASKVLPISKSTLSVGALRLEARNEGAWSAQLRARVDYDVLPANDPDLFNLSIQNAGTGALEVFRNVSCLVGHPRRIDKVLENESQFVRLAGAVPPARPQSTKIIGSQVLNDNTNPAPITANTHLVGNAGAASDNLQRPITNGSMLTIAGKTVTFSTGSTVVSTDASGNHTIGIGTGSVLAVSDVLAAIDKITGATGASASSVDGNGHIHLSDGNTQNPVLGGTGNALAALGLSAGPAWTIVVDVGTDGDFLVLNDFIGAGKAAGKLGLYALGNADLFNILCIPPYLNGTDKDVDDDVIAEAAKYCLDRRAMLLMDPPITWNTKEKAKVGIAAVTGIIDSNSRKNTALFFPRLKQIDSNGQIDEFVPCGAVAGIFARTDSSRGVWKAPAGFDAGIAGVQQLSVPLNDGENGELNPLGINCIRTMPAAGRVVWGSRTLQGDDRLASEWKYIPVRRTALFIEESLYRGTHWVVFEPNDEPLWAQIRLNVGAFMNDLFRQGAFQGATPRDAYFVKCDSETNPQSDINKGIVNILVGFAPLKPAEFVVIKLQQIAGQIQT